MRHLLLLSLFGLLGFACQQEETPVKPSLYFPPNSNTWESTSPASLGWDVAKLEALNTFLAENDTRAFMVLVDGKIVVEEYFGKQFDGVTNFSASSNWYWASAGKTMTAALVGIAESQGKINFDTKTSAYLGQGWTSLSPQQEDKITVRHQLTMTTGLDDYADANSTGDDDCTDPACLKYKAEPGARWAYHNAPYTLLDGVIAAGTGQSLNTFLSEQMLSKIGMSALYIKSGYNNVLYSTPRSMARFGLLLLARGQWNGTQIIPEDYVDLMMNSSQSLNPAYGHLTWLNGKGTFKVPGLQTSFPGSMTPFAPADMFAAMGKNGQVINVVPSKNLVMIRMGDNPDSALVPFLFQDQIWERLKEIIK